MAKKRIHGIWIRTGTVERTTLEEAQSGWESLGTAEFPLGTRPDEEESDHDWLLPQLRAHAEELSGEYAVALPLGRAVARVVELPTSEPEEIDAMISLQIDKFSPFPVEQLRVSYERLAQSPNQTRVLVVAYPDDGVDEIGQVFRDLKRYPQWLDVDVLGWWWLLRRNHPLPETGQDVVFIVNGEDTYLIVASNGVPMLIRSLGTDRDMERASFCEMVVEETTYTVTSLETEWGAASDDTRVALWHDGAAPADLVEAMRSAWDMEVATHPLESLGPLSAGLAWRAADREEGMVNLAPPEWLAAEQARQTQKRFLVGTAVLAGCWAVVVGIFLGALGIQKSRLAGLRDQIAELAGPVATVREMREKTKFLEEYMDPRFSALETLRAITVAPLPAGVDLSQLTYAKGGTIVIRGTAATPESVYEFFDDLGRSDLFHDVKLGKVDVVKGRNVFRMTAESGDGET